MAVFVTDDSYLRPDGNLDPDDQRVLDQAGADGALVVMCARDALEQLSKVLAAGAPTAPDELPPIGQPVDGDSLAEFGHAANRQMAVLIAELGLTMTEPRAVFVRQMRCAERASWRRVARQYYLLYGGDWAPPSNQLAGMALCQAAASFFDQSPRRSPWN